MKKRINVTESIIQDSIRRNPEFCMIANAVKQTIAPGVDVCVIADNKNCYQIELSGPETESHLISLSRQVNKYIEDFDCGWLPDPFYLVLDIPEQFLEA